MSLIVPARLRMRSLQLRLNSQWDYEDEESRISWDVSCPQDLQWWSEDNLTPGVPLKILLPDFHLLTDASDQGWGATLEDLQESGSWSPLQQSFSINFRELLVVVMAIGSFLPLLQAKTVALFSDNVTTFFI